jgi:hypothetical protein
MKNFLLLICILVCTCAQAQKTKTDLQSVSWLLGKWERTDAKPGHVAREIWTKVSGSEMKGIAMNIKGGADTVFLEKVRIVAKDDGLYYLADIPENKGEISFKMTSVTNKGFVCENAEHDFPKKITYNMKGKKLKAIISGDGKSMEYNFERSN